MHVCMYWKDILQNVISGYLWIMRLWVIIFLFLQLPCPISLQERVVLYISKVLQLDYITLRMRSKKKAKETVTYSWEKTMSHFVNYLEVVDSSVGLNPLLCLACNDPLSPEVQLHKLKRQAFWTVPILCFLPILTKIFYWVRIIY